MSDQANSDQFSQQFFPQISGANWPSNVLQAWMTLHRLGVPQHNMRLLPELAHFSAPEVVEEAPPLNAKETLDELPSIPHSSRYDRWTEVLTLDAVNPQTVRPRLTVNIRADTIFRFYKDAQGVEQCREEMVGRLSHFMAPMMAGIRLPDGDVEPPRPLEKPLARMTRQVCAAYPELMATIQSDMGDVLSKIAEGLEKCLGGQSPEAQRELLQQISEFANALPMTPSSASASAGIDYEAAKEAYRVMTDKLRVGDDDARTEYERRQALSRFRTWSDLLFDRDVKAKPGRLEEHIEALSTSERTEQKALFEQMLYALEYENPQARQKIVLEMMEILTTEAFTATAVCDYLWGMGWIHGAMADFRADTKPARLDGHFMSVQGGMDRQTIQMILARKWMQTGAFLGVGTLTAPSLEGRSSGRHNEPNPIDRECLDRSVLEAAEWDEVLALLSWRGAVADPLLLFQTAARRLLHSDTKVEMDASLVAPSRYGTLTAQPGATAVLGARGALRYPGVKIFLPLVEAEGAESERARAVLEILTRLFLPVCLRVEVIWQESVARLGRSAWLQHDFQAGTRLADSWSAASDTVQEEDCDPLTL